LFIFEGITLLVLKTNLKGLLSINEKRDFSSEVSPSRPNCVKLGLILPPTTGAQVSLLSEKVLAKSSRLARVIFLDS